MIPLQQAPQNNPYPLRVPVMRPTIRQPPSRPPPLIAVGPGGNRLLSPSHIPREPLNIRPTQPRIVPQLPPQFPTQQRPSVLVASDQQSQATTMRPPSDHGVSRGVDPSFRAIPPAGHQMQQIFHHQMRGKILVQKGQPLVRPREPIVQSRPPMVQAGQPMIQPRQPIVQPGPFGRPRQPTLQSRGPTFVQPRQATVLQIPTPLPRPSLPSPIPGKTVSPNNAGPELLQVYLQQPGMF